MPADERTTRSDLEQFFSAFHRSVTNGVRAYYADYAKNAHRHRTNTRRDITRDEIVYDLRGALDDADGIRFVDHNQTTSVVALERYRVRVKKADEDGAVELAKTQASFDFQCNTQGDLFGHEHTNLYLSYVPNPNEPENPTVYLICPNAGGYDFVIELEPPAAELAGEISGAPAPLGDGGDLVRIPEKAKPEESE